jgi:hypothetical protein
MATVAVALAGLLSAGCEQKTQSPRPDPARSSGGSSGSKGSGGSGGSSSAPTGTGPGGGSGGSSGSSSGSDGGLPPVMESGMTSVKFCNLIGYEDMSDLILDLELGSKKVKLSANTGQCAPMKGQTCASIPAGTIPFVLSLKGQVVMDGVAQVPADGAMIILAEFDDMTKEPTLTAGGLKPGFKCEDFDLTTPPPDGGVAPDGGGSTGTGGTGARPPRI